MTNADTPQAQPERTPWPTGEIAASDPSQTGRAVSAHVDPEGEAPWALQLVAHVEKSDPPTRTALLEATARAVVAVLEAQCDPDRADVWNPAVVRWEEGRIRKLVRRARGAAWDKVCALESVRGVSDTAEVVALVPGPTDQVDPSVRKLQVEGLVLDDPECLSGVRVGFSGLVIALTPLYGVPDHPGKAAAQAGHCAQVGYRQRSSAALAAWREAGFPLCVIWPDEEQFADMTAMAPVQITDAGFTVVPPGTMTALAYWV